MRMLRKIVLLTIGVFVMAALGQTQSTSEPPATAQTASDSNAEKEIRTLELKLIDLIIHANWDEYEKYLTADYAFIGHDGKLENKNEVMAAFRNGPRKIIVMEPDELHVRVYGEAAVLQGRATISVREAGRVNTRHESFTDVFVKQNGRWFLAAEQNTAAGK